MPIRHEEGCEVKSGTVNLSILRRPRLVLAALSAVALFALPVVALASTDGPVGRVTSATDAPATPSPALQSVVDHGATRGPLHRPAGPSPVGALLAVVFAGLAVVAEVMGRAHRRLTDVGDRWRCLLFGAPPLAHR